MSGRSALESYNKGEGWWTTEISRIQKNEVNIRGYKMEDLIGNITYPQMLYLLLCGEVPDENRAALFESVLVAGADHGPRAPSIAAGRMAATCGISFNSAVATGINLLGDSHGGATEQGMKLLYETWEKAGQDEDNLNIIIDEELDRMLENKEKVPGIGHQLHDDDPRVHRLYALAEPMADDNIIPGVYLKVMEQYRCRLQEKKKRPITMNIDGAAAAVQCEIGLPAEAAKGIFALSRGMGIAAHAYEEMKTGVLVKGPCPNEEELVKYTGPESRSISGGEST